MFPYNVIIARIVVAVKRLAPEMELPFRADVACLMEKHVFTVFIVNFGGIINSAEKRLSQPKDIEHSYLFAVSFPSDNIKCAAKLINANDIVDVIPFTG